jgi:hypothetical protein
MFARLWCGLDQAPDRALARSSTRRFRRRAWNEGNGDIELAVVIVARGDSVNPPASDSEPFDGAIGIGMDALPLGHHKPRLRVRPTPSWIGSPSTAAFGNCRDAFQSISAGRLRRASRRAAFAARRAARACSRRCLAAPDDRSWLIAQPHGLCAAVASRREWLAYQIVVQRHRSLRLRIALEGFGLALAVVHIVERGPGHHRFSPSI